MDALLSSASWLVLEGEYLSSSPASSGPGKTEVRSRDPGRSRDPRREKLSVDPGFPVWLEW